MVGPSSTGTRGASMACVTAVRELHGPTNEASASDPKCSGERPLWGGLARPAVYRLWLDQASVDARSDGCGRGRCHVSRGMLVGFDPVLRVVGKRCFRL